MAKTASFLLKSNTSMFFCPPKCHISRKKCKELCIIPHITKTTYWWNSSQGNLGFNEGLQLLMSSQELVLSREASNALFDNNNNNNNTLINAVNLLEKKGKS